ncbi:MAG TPA: helix-turn-helix domain-containing protein [Ktedonobacteraceae bacterium]|nr:helix-turn-helix domain-containing protein [Ktedonobacteraceae bacterium]
MNFSVYQSPLMIGAATAGLVFALAILLGIYQERRVIGASLSKAGQALFSQIGFFTIVILVFLVISVLESGEFFNANITHEALFGILGYALALGFDLVSVVCMLARMAAIRLRDERGARLNLLGVVLCAAVSAFANAAASLQGYNASNLDHTPWWMQQVAPWLGTIFPTMIVVLSLTTDHLLDHRGPARGIDLTTYQKQEKHRVDMLRIKLDTEKELLTLDRELTSLRAERAQVSGRPTREWFFQRWIRPVTPPTQEGITEQIGQVVDAARQPLEVQQGQLQHRLTVVDTHLNQLATQTTSHDEALKTVREQMSHLAAMLTRLDTLTSTVATLAAQMDTTGVQGNMPHATTDYHLSAQVGQRAMLQDATDGEVVSYPLSTMEAGRTRCSRQTIKLDTLRMAGKSVQATTIGGRADLERRIQAAQQVLGLGASNRQIARVAHCSPTTVARWLAQQGEAHQEQEQEPA